jgi:hypoxanthine phosphoribosyltransferase
MNHELKTMIEYKSIQSKINNFATQLNSEYINKELIIICILKGAVPFLKDLCNNLNIDYDIYFMDINSYKGMERNKITSENITFDVKNKHILVIDDICDTGHTLKYITEELKNKNPKTIITAVLLNKVIKSKVFNANTSLFEIPDKFVVGYGLDFNNKYRFLKDIYTITI